jgi:TPR repeat protein
MKKNKISIRLYTHIFCIVFFLPITTLFTTLLLAQETYDWAKPLKKAQDSLSNKEYLIATQEFKIHAKSGHGLVQFNVALFYDLGWGVNKQRDTACVWYNKASKSNMPRAIQQIRHCYQQRMGLNKTLIKRCYGIKKTMSKAFTLYTAMPACYY